LPHWTTTLFCIYIRAATADLLSSLQSETSPGKSIETVKHFLNGLKVLSQFRTPYCTKLRHYSKRPKRSGAHDNAQMPNVQFSVPTSAPENCVGLCNIAGVCCNSHLLENMLISNRFTSTQSKSVLGFQNLGCQCKILGCHFDTQKRL